MIKNKTINEVGVQVELREQKKSTVLEWFNPSIYEEISPMISALVDIDMLPQNTIELVSKLYDGLRCGKQSVIAVSNTKKEATIHDCELFKGLVKISNRRISPFNWVYSEPILKLSNKHFKGYMKALEESEKILVFSYADCEKEIINIIDIEDGKVKEVNLTTEQENIKKNLIDLLSIAIVQKNMPCIFYNFDEKAISKIESHFGLKFTASIVYEKDCLFSDVEKTFINILNENGCVYQKGYRELLYSYYKYNKSKYDSLTFLEYVDDIESLIKKRQIKGVFKNSNFEITSIFDKIRAVDIELLFKGIVGMDEIKAKFSEIRAYYNLKTLMSINNSARVDMRLHLLLTGNPGTGKTTVAKIYSNFLKELGVVPAHGFIEVKADDFVSRWVGDSGIKTNNLISQHRGNVIFIDEAYSIAMNSHGKEALSVIVKEMEKNSDGTIFIFAGYKDEMREFLSANPGIKSRIAFHFELENYTKEQLGNMFEIKIKNAGFEMSKESLSIINRKISQTIKDSESGNGRYIENLVNEVILSHSQYVYQNHITEEVNQIGAESLFNGNTFTNTVLAKKIS